MSTEVPPTMLEVPIGTRLSTVEPEIYSKGHVYVPSLTGRWTRYLTTVRNRRKSFVFALHKRACPWSQAERATVEQAFARARNRF